MFTKKEIVITTLFIVFFSILVLFLPFLEGKISNRKTYEYNEEEKKEREIGKYVCTFSSSSNLLKNVIEATFYLDQEQVTRIYTKESKTYMKKEDYNYAVRSIPANVETENLERKTTLDELNYTIITVQGENIKEDSKVNYPTTYHELTEYLEKNKYTCTIRYKN